MAHSPPPPLAEYVAPKSGGTPCEGGDWQVVPHVDPWHIEGKTEGGETLEPPPLYSGEEGLDCIPNASILGISDPSELHCNRECCPWPGRILITSYRIVFQCLHNGEVIFTSPVGCIYNLTIRAGRDAQLRREREAFLRQTGDDSPIAKKKAPLTASFYSLELLLRTGTIAVFSVWCDDGNDLAKPISALCTPKKPIALQSTGPIEHHNYRPRLRVLQEYKRMGVFIPACLLHSDEVAVKPAQTQRIWRISEVNRRFQICSTYPKFLAVPYDADDDVLCQSAAFRAKGRLPVLAWRCSKSGVTISRSSQPLVGMLNKRSQGDEKLFECIQNTALSDSDSPDTRKTLYVMDLRPRGNAFANQLTKGGGHESSNYANVKVLFCGIHNIHVVQDAMMKVQEAEKYRSPKMMAALRDDGYDSDDASDSGSGPRPGQLMSKVGNEPLGSRYSGAEEAKWLQHIRSIIAASLEVVSIVEDHCCPVLVHCSDGWDRTPQVTSLSQVLLDPHYRTYNGFCSLIEKDWVSLGHRFASRASGMRVTSPIPVSGYHEEDYDDTGRPIISGPPAPDSQSPTFVQWLTCMAQIVDQHTNAFEFNHRLLWLLAEQHCSGKHPSFLCDTDKQRLKDYRVYKSGMTCPWTLLYDEYGEGFINPQYCKVDSSIRDLDMSLRRLNSWILPRLSPQTNHAERRKRQELEQERSNLEDVIRQQQEEMTKLLQKVRALEERYTEDVGHRPVEVREAHPGGRNARIQPIIKHQVVTELRDETTNDDDIFDEDSSLVLVSHINQNVQSSETVCKKWSSWI